MYGRYVSERVCVCVCAMLEDFFDDFFHISSLFLCPLSVSNPHFSFFPLSFSSFQAFCKCNTIKQTYFSSLAWPIRGWPEVLSMWVVALWWTVPTFKGTPSQFENIPTDGAQTPAGQVHPPWGNIHYFKISCGHRTPGPPPPSLGRWGWASVSHGPCLVLPCFPVYSHPLLP